MGFAGNSHSHLPPGPRKKKKKKKTQRNMFPVVIDSGPKKNKKVKLQVFLSKWKLRWSGKPTIHSDAQKRGIPFWLVEFEGEPFPRKRKTGRHWASGIQIGLEALELSGGNFQVLEVRGEKATVHLPYKPRFCVYTDPYLRNLANSSL